MTNGILRLCTLLTVSLTTFSCLHAQTYFEDFESANIGDPVSSLGITGHLGGYLIDSVGVDGSHGFEAVIVPNINWQVGLLPVNFPLQNVGDLLSLSIDAKISITSSNSLGFPTGLFDFGTWGPNDTYLAQFLIDGDASNLLLWHGVWGENVSFISEYSVDSVALTKIGLNSLPGESDFFTFGVDFYKRNVHEHVFATYVLNGQGSEVFRHVTAGIDMDPIFQNPQFTRFTVVEWPNFESVCLDNFLYEVRSVLLGDVNRDGEVNLLDVTPFVDILTSDYQIEADINEDGYVNLLDVPAFVEILD